MQLDTQFHGDLQSGTCSLTCNPIQTWLVGPEFHHNLTKRFWQHEILAGVILRSGVSWGQNFELSRALPSLDLGLFWMWRSMMCLPGISSSAKRQWLNTSEHYLWLRLCFPEFTVFEAACGSSVFGSCTKPASFFQRVRRQPISLSLLPCWHGKVQLWSSTLV